MLFVECRMRHATEYKPFKQGHVKVVAIALLDSQCVVVDLRSQLLMVANQDDLLSGWC
jgi:hypothetical protein